MRKRSGAIGSKWESIAVDDIWKIRLARAKTKVIDCYMEFIKQYFNTIKVSVVYALT